MLTIGAKYSVLQSSSFASIIPSDNAVDFLHPLISQPSDDKDLTNSKKKVFVIFSWTKIVSTAPQIPGLRIFALTQISIAFLFSASLSTYIWQIPSRCAKTGTLASFSIWPTKSLPPLGTITSIVLLMPWSIFFTMFLSVSFIIWIAFSLMSACLRPFNRLSWIAIEEFMLSDPPLKIEAFPDFKHKAPASAVTLGLLS